MVKKIKTEMAEQYEGWNLHQLESELAKVRRENPEDAKVRSAALQFMMRKRREYIKGLAAEFEKTNRSHVLLFDSGKTYSKMIGNSLVFYVQSLCPRLDRTCRVRSDTDDYFHSALGVVSVNYETPLLEQFARANLVEDMKLSTPELHFFKLPSTYSDEHIEQLIRAFNDDQFKGAQQVLNKRVLPKTTRKIADLVERTAHACRKVEDKFLSRTVLEPLMAEVQEVSSTMLDYSLHSGKPELSLYALARAVQATRKVRNRLVIIDYLRLFPQNKYAVIIDVSAQILDELEKEWKKMSRTDKALAAKIASEVRRRG